MEVKINKEIQEYTESVFFGLSLRQTVFSVLAIGVAVTLYFVLKPHLSVETLSWVCVLAAFPFALLGFVKYHGMNAEQFAWVWFRSEILEPRRYACKPNNIYFELTKKALKKAEKEALKNNVKIP